jgi:hypothetical protein
VQEIPTLFLYEPPTGKRWLVTPEVNPECAWVLAGEGRPTLKWDGTACLARNGLLFRRHRHREEQGDPPPGWLHWSLDKGARSGHGWIPVGNGPADRWHREACENLDDGHVLLGTYELCGPRVNANPHGFLKHLLIRHGDWPWQAANPRTFDNIRSFLADPEFAKEGIVWWHPDGRMAKIKRRDFGLPWPVKHPAIAREKGT